MNKLVSIITAVYNGERYVNDFIVSILNQTYSNIELVIVDDGSTDNTKNLIENFRCQLEKKLSRFLLISKSNGGQSQAINSALKVLSGEYLAWVDFDDLLTTDCIEEKVKAIEDTKADLLISQCKCVDYDNNESIIGYTWGKDYTREELLKNELTFSGFRFEPGSFFIRTSKFFEIYPERHIYDKCGIWTGCNIQMTFPMIYSGKIAFLHKPLYIYRLNRKGHHLRNYTFEHDLERLKAGNDVWYSVINNPHLNVKEKNEYLSLVNQVYYKNIMQTAYRHNEKKTYKEYYKKLSHHTLKQKLKYLLFMIGIRKKG